MTGLVEAPHSSTTPKIQHPRPPPLTIYRLASFTTPRPRVLRLAHILPRRHVISFIKYGGVEAVRGDREYCGLEPGRQASSDNGMPCTAHSRGYQDILTELGSVL